MSTITRTPDQLLASEPKRSRGIATPTQREADRTIRYRWTVAHAPNRFGETVEIVTCLEITHYKKDYRRAAHYRASLRREEHAATSIAIIFNGRNGLVIDTDANGAGRYNGRRLEAYAERVFAGLRADPPAEALLYFDADWTP